MKKKWVPTELVEKLKLAKKIQHDSAPPTAIFIFRRDLRLFDNTALLAAAKSYSILPIFILTPEQVLKNEYRSSNAIQFMVQSLMGLRQDIEEKGGVFHVYFGETISVLQNICSNGNIKAIFFNKDYTPYSLRRDAAIVDWAHKNAIDCHSYHDCLLVDKFDDIKAANGSTYFLFTHFYAKASSIKPRKCDISNVIHWARVEGDFLFDFKGFLLEKGSYQENNHICVQGGRKEGLELLVKACIDLKDYAKSRSDITRSCSGLSAHNKFGTLSIREVFSSFSEPFGSGSELIKQLYWRDFFYYIGHFYPPMYEGEPIPVKQHFKSINWSGTEEQFRKWCAGETGYPLIDAAMRDLNTTGSLHNRLRMLVAMFLTKDLIIDWRLGEKYFAQKLVDIDRAQNCGNWEWCAGTGADGSPWLRIFNPWTQQKKLDPDAIYIKRWVHELADISASDITDWETAWQKYPGVYLKPIVNHKIQREAALAAYGVQKRLK